MAEFETLMRQSPAKSAANSVDRRLPNNYALDISLNANSVQQPDLNMSGLSNISGIAKHNKKMFDPTGDMSYIQSLKLQSSLDPNATKQLIAFDKQRFNSLEKLPKNQHGLFVSSERASSMANFVKQSIGQKSAKNKMKENTAKLTKIYNFAKSPIPTQYLS